MKKSIILITVLVFLLGFAAAAFAVQADIPATTPVVASGSTHIKLSGSLRVRGWYLGNQSGVGAQDTTTVTEPAKNTDGAYYDERVRLNMDVNSGPVSGRVSLESNAGNEDTWAWGQGLNTKPTDLYIREAWINYSGSELLGVPAGIKIGHQPLALGPANLFFDNTKYGDDALVLYANPTPKSTAMLLTFKPFENSIYQSNDDLDGYVGVFDGVWSGQTLGIDYTYLHQSGASAPAGDSQFPGLSFSNVELFAKGSINGIGYLGQLDYQFGHIENYGTTDLHAHGYAIWLGANKAVSSANLRAAFAYGSGASSNDNGSQLVSFLSPHKQYFTLVYGYTLEDAGLGGLSFNDGRDDGVDNTMLLNLGADYSATPKLTLSGDFYWLHANSTYGFADVINGGNASKDIGEEVDVKGAYHITKNLTYFADAGVLFAGNFYKDRFGETANTTPFTLMHGLELSF